MGRTLMLQLTTIANKQLDEKCKKRLAAVQGVD